MKMPTIILLVEKISCLAQFSMKKSFITSGPGPLSLLITHVQRHEKMILMACAHSESLDQPVHTCGLIFATFEKKSWLRREHLAKTLCNNSFEWVINWRKRIIDGNEFNTWWEQGI